MTNFYKKIIYERNKPYYVIINFIIMKLISKMSYWREKWLIDHFSPRVKKMKLSLRGQLYLINSNYFEAAIAWAEQKAYCSEVRDEIIKGNTAFLLLFDKMVALGLSEKEQILLAEKGSYDNVKNFISQEKQFCAPAAKIFLDRFLAGEFDNKLMVTYGQINLSITEDEEAYLMSKADKDFILQYIELGKLTPKGEIAIIKRKQWSLVKPYGKLYQWSADAQDYLDAGWMYD